jgi:EamA domain-containing membrane protein RarD
MPTYQHQQLSPDTLGRLFGSGRASTSRQSTSDFTVYGAVNNQDDNVSEAKSFMKQHAVALLLSLVALIFIIWFAASKKDSETRKTFNTITYVVALGGLGGVAYLMTRKGTSKGTSKGGTGVST